MSKRSISDNEIGLIKAMLNRGMANKDIQFFFNRPDRAVNSGRITEIGENTYSNSSQIKPATDLELDDFITSQGLDSALATYKETEKIKIGDVNKSEFAELKALLEGYVGNDVIPGGNQTQLPISNRELEIISLSLEIAEKSSELPQWSVATIYHLRGLQAVLIELNNTLAEAFKTGKTLLPLAKILGALIGKLQGILEAVKPKMGEDKID